MRNLMDAVSKGTEQNNIIARNRGRQRKQAVETYLADF